MDSGAQAEERVRQYDTDSATSGSMSMLVTKDGTKMRSLACRVWGMLGLKGL